MSALRMLVGEFRAPRRSGAMLRTLAVLVLLAATLAAGAARGQEVGLPGTWFDQDKYHFGGLWGQNYYDDLNGNGRYDPDEPWDDLFHAGWVLQADLSCWAAVAANLLRCAGGPDRYHAWMYVEGVHTGEPHRRFWTESGGVESAFWSDGYAYDSIGVYADPWETDPTEIVEQRLRDSLAVGIGLGWPSSGMGHGVTVYAIDRVNQTMTIGDSDGDDGGNDFSTFAYTWDSGTGKWTFSGYGGAPNIGGIATFDTNDFIGDGAGGAGSDWHRAANWSAGHVPASNELPKIHFTGLGTVNVDGFAATLKTILRGQTKLDIGPGGLLRTQTMYAGDTAQVWVDGGTLQVMKEAVNDGLMLVLPGAYVEADWMRVGSHDYGAIVQSGGDFSTTPGGGLALGDRPGIEGEYQLLDGRVYAAQLEVGRSGTGTFHHNGGSVQAPLHLYLGVLPGSAGTYNLSGASSTLSAATEFIGYEGPAEFHHYDGSNECGGVLWLGYESGGTYILDGGTLTAEAMVIGAYAGGFGVFWHEGGQCIIERDLDMAEFHGTSTAMYILNDGLLRIQRHERVGGAGGASFTQAGGTHEVWGNLTVGAGAGSLSTYAIRGGTLDVADGIVAVGWDGTGFLTLGGGTVIADELNIHPTRGTLLSDPDSTSLQVNHLNGLPGTFDLNGWLLLGHAGGSGFGSFALAPGQSLEVDGLEVGYEASGTFDDHGGSLTAVSLGVGIWSSISGQYTMNSPNSQLHVNWETVGAMGNGTFTQHDGEHTVTDWLIVGNGPGTGQFRLSAGILNTGAVVLGGGPDSTGTLTQSGGTHAIADFLSLGAYYTDAYGAYLLNDGRLNTGGLVFIGRDGTGVFNQLGGAHRLTNSSDMYIGYLAGADGRYSIGGGLLSSPGGKIYIGYDGLGELQLAGGTIVADELVKHATNGTFTSGGDGTLRVNTLTGFGKHFSLNGSLQIGHSGGSGAASWSVNDGGSLATTLDLTVAYDGIGELSIGTGSGGGTVSAGRYLYLAEWYGGQATVTIGRVGSLSAPYQHVGQAGTATFRQSGGTNTASHYLHLGELPGAHGVYELDRGTLSVGTLVVAVAGSGQFDWTGGTLSASRVVVNTSGLMNVAHDWIYGGELRVDGGTLDLGDYYLSTDGAGSQASITGGRIACHQLVVGEFGLGELDQDGGVVEVAELFVASWDTSNGQYALGGAGSLDAPRQSIGYFGVGSLTQTGGTNTADILYLGESCTGHGTYLLGGGLLDVGELRIGQSGTGEFHWTAGSLAAADVVIHRGNMTVEKDWTCGGRLWVHADGLLELGAHRLSLDGPAGTPAAGSLQGGEVRAAFLHVGQTGDAEWTQDAGATRLNNELIVGVEAGSNGYYTMQGGLLTSSYQEIGDAGAGSFFHDGGLNQVTNDLTLGRQATGVGIYSLIGPGRLECGNLRVGQAGWGEVTLDLGGELPIANALYLGDESGSHGTVRLQDGQLQAYRVEIGGQGVGNLIQSGGSATVASSVQLGTRSGGFGSLELSGGTFAGSGGQMVVGASGTGELNLSGGAQLVGFGDVFLGLYAASQGAAFQTGGTHRILNSLSIGGLSLSPNNIYHIAGSESILEAASLYVGGLETIAGGAGTLWIDADATVQIDGPVVVWEPGELMLSGGTLVAETVDVAGTLAGSGTIVAPTVTIGGVLSPGGGFGFGAMAIDGSQALGGDPTLGNSSTGAAVPEPSSCAMLLTALLGLAAWRRRPKR